MSFQARADVRRIICMLLALLTLAACGCGEVETVGEEHLAAAREVVIDEESVSFTDALGEERRILKHEDARVLVLYASFTTLWYEAGGEAVGCIGGESARELYVEQLGRDITEDEGMTVVSTSASAKKWDIEAMLALRPELIICSTAMNGYATIEPAARAAGIPVIAVDYESLSDYLKWFRVFSALNGREELWEEVALAALERVEAVIAEARSELPKSPRVLCLFSGTESLQANTSATVVGGMLRELGATNVIDGSEVSRVTLDLEAVLAADPDVILVQHHLDADTAWAQVEQTLGESPIWQSLRAVREGRVYYLDRELFHNKPNRRFADAYEMLAALLTE